MNAIVKQKVACPASSTVKEANALAEKVFSFTDVPVYKAVWITDEYGDKTQVREMCGYKVDVCRKAGASDDFVAGLLKPCTDADAARFLFELMAHKPWTRGEETWRIVVKDTISRLKGNSVIAVSRACKYFQEQPDTPYFPDPARFVEYVKNIDRELRRAVSKQPSSATPQEKKGVSPEPRTFRQKRRVGRYCKIALRPTEAWNSWEKKFMTAYPRHARGV